MSRDCEDIFKTVFARYPDCLALGQSDNPSEDCICDKLAKEGYAVSNLGILDVREWEGVEFLLAVVYCEGDSTNMADSINCTMLAQLIGNCKLLTAQDLALSSIPYEREDPPHPPRF